MVGELSPVTKLLNDISKHIGIRSMAQDVIRKHWFMCDPAQYHDETDCLRCKEARTRINLAEIKIEGTVRDWVSALPVPYIREDKASE